jgi:hypothetical protein
VHVATVAPISGGSGSTGGGPAGFSCAAVSTGSGSVLNLIYAPVAADSGTLTLDFSYPNDFGIAKMGTVSIAYFAGKLPR